VVQYHPHLLSFMADKTKISIKVLQINRRKIGSLIMPIDLARTKAKIRRFRSGNTFLKLSLISDRRLKKRRGGVQGKNLQFSPAVLVLLPKRTIFD